MADVYGREVAHQETEIAVRQCSACLNAMLVVHDGCYTSR